ncbi:restriction endonuclease subunit S [Vibrio owensii]|uniref:restriction endonuclease subunit S n=1 Tax=Vibrio owensii TaxID=696485 RepID=UPI003DA1A693
MTEQMNVPKLRFSEFDSQWKQIPLGEVTSYLKGFAFKSEDYLSNGQADSRLIRVSDLSSASVKLDNQKVFLPPELMESSARYKLNDDDILITTVGSKPELRESAVGRAIYINKAHGYLNQNLLIMRTKGEQSPTFIFSQLNTPRYINHITNIQRGNANQSNITVVDLFEYRVSTTSLPEQQKIASFLSKVDEKITLLTEKKAKLTEYKKGVMQQLFDGKWQEQDGQLTFIPPTLRFKADDGSEFPDWEINKLGTRTKKVGSGATPRGGEKAYSSDGVPFIRSQNVNNNKLLLDEIRFIPEHTDASMKRSRVEANDILLNITGASIGRSCVVPSDFVKGNLNQHVCIIRLVADNPHFVQSYLASYFGEKLIFQGMAGGGREGLNFESIKGFKLPFPSLGEQNKIANFLSALDQKIDLANSELEKAKEWKKGLLQQMFV